MIPVEAPVRRRGILVGFGTIGAGHLQGYRRQEALQLVAIVDGNEARRRVARAAAPDIEVHADLATALDRADVDFIDICTPPVHHLEAMAAGLERGMWVLCEKPLVRHADELAEVVALLDGEEGTLYPCHNYGFAPSIGALGEIIRDHGRLGPRLEGRFWTHRTGHARGVAEWDAHWRRDPAISGGGILCDHGPHSVYLASRLVGSRPVRVQCTTRPGSAPWSTTEEGAEILLDFDDARVEIELTWAAPTRRTGYELRGGAGLVRVVGHELTWDVDGRTGTRSFPPDFDDPSHGSWFALLLADVARRMDRQDQNLDLIEEALMTIETIGACYRSAAQGGLAVDVPRQVVPAALADHQAVGGER
jgi:predicted dehydrogenase